MIQIAKFPVSAILITATVALIGCGSDGPDLGDVSGIVKLDGQPLPAALLTFRPVTGGRPSYAQTNEDGAFELVYTNEQSGALVGEHTVEITTLNFGDPDQDIRPTPEKLDPQYNARSELKEIVESGDNTIEFDLQSQPQFTGHRTARRTL